MGHFSLTRSFSLNQQYNMKAFIVLFALVAAAYAEAEAEADPYLLYGGYNGYAGWGGWTGYAGLPYGAYGYTGYPYAAHPYGASAVVKTVEVEPAKVEVKALATPAVVAAPAAYTYHHAAPVAYAGYGYAGFPYAATYGAYPYAGYAHAAAYAHAPSDPTNPHLVHTSRVGICTNYLGAQVPC